MLRTRVLAAAGELGYRSHSQALSLRTGATKTVGFLVSDIANPILARMVRARSATSTPAVTGSCWPFPTTT